MKLPFTSGNRLVVGIDIGSHAVKVCELKRTNRKGYRLVALGGAVVPEGAVGNDALNAPEVLGPIISNLFKNLKIKTEKSASPFPAIP